MKYFLTAILLIVVICLYRQSNPAPKASPAISTGFYIFLNDISGSDPWLNLPKKEIYGMLMQDTLEYDFIQMAGIKIDGDSRRQVPYLSPLVACRLKPLDGNLYHRSAIQQQNKNAFNQFRLQCAYNTDSLMRYIAQPRTAPRTDVNGALSLALELTGLPNYQNADIYLILLSDCLQDMPDGKPLQTFIFPPNTIIYIIGKSPKVDLKKIFPSNRIIVMPTFKAQFFGY